MEKLKLKDYQAPSFDLETVNLTFELSPEKTVVRSKMNFKKISDSSIFLNGVELELLSIKVNGDENVTFQKQEDGLLVTIEGTEATIEIENTIDPSKNTHLEGLYMSSGRFFTQNEPQGFRRITFFPDRPDVMSTYTTSIVADKEKYPVMLSNGDLIEQDDLSGGRHRCVWHDPHRKPCYLFALVAGDFARLDGEFETASGRNVALQFFSEPSRIKNCEFALESLQRAMKWDEERFGLEYDLDTYMVVVVDDFNGGAMENKGLNIFNTRCVLAHPHLTTDDEYLRIESVVGHEYFHNWTGNRVTLRDWFHLSLKEGLTVFRDQEFSSDLHSRGVVRIENVQELWVRQFPEDAGPNSHAVRPTEAFAVDNFFSPTIYEKGAEIIRMIFTICGREGFRKGMDHFVKENDGQAVTIEEFVRSFEITCDVDLSQFRRWYETPGTPQVRVEKTNGGLSLTQQSRNSEPLDIPISYAVFNSDGSQDKEGILHLNEFEKEIEVSPGQSVSLLRGYSAPVELDYPLEVPERVKLIESETDRFQVWYQLRLLLLDAMKTGNLEPYQKAMSSVLVDDRHDQLFRAFLLELPTDTQIAQSLGGFDPEKIWSSRLRIAEIFGSVCADLKASSVERLEKIKAQVFSPEIAAQRAFDLKVLRYCIASQDSDCENWAWDNLGNDNATVKTSLGSSLIQFGQRVRADVYSKLRGSMAFDDFLMNKYYVLVALNPEDDALEWMDQEIDRPPFEFRNPNNVYSLFLSFSSQNLRQYHHTSGRGYEFLADCIVKLDQINPSTAARLCRGFERLKELDADRQQTMRKVMDRIHSTPSISPNVRDLTEPK